MDKIIKIGICGKIEIEIPESIVKIKLRVAIKEILQKYNTDKFIAYTSLAKGTDTIFADIVTKEFKNVSLRIILPFEIEEYLKSTQIDIIKFDNYVKKYGIHKNISENYLSNNDDKNVLFYESGKLIVNECDEMIFAWDFKNSNGKGGTKDILDYYIEKNNYSNLNIIDISDEEIEMRNIDKEAIKIKNNYTKIWNSTLFLTFAAVLIFAFHSSFIKEGDYKKNIFIFIECVFLIVAFLLGIFYKNINKKLIEIRIKTENFRINNLKLKSGFNINTNNSLNNFAKIRIICFIDEQLKYHENKIEESYSKKNHALESLKNQLKYSFLLIVIAELILILFHPFSNLIKHFLHSLINFLIIFIPGSYATIETYLYFNEMHTIKKQSEIIYTNLDRLKKDIIFETKGETIDKKYFLVLNKILLDENSYWKDFISSKPIDFKPL